MTMIEVKEMFSKYIQVYPQDKKYYHSKNHIDTLMIDVVSYWDDFVAAYEVKKKDEAILLETLYLAILFHDIVYKVGAKDNEEKSAEYVKNAIPEYKYLDEVVDLILSTKIDNKNFDTPLKKFFHDLDWKGFMFYDDMIVNEEKIKNEAIRDGFTEEQFREGQLNFYKSSAKKNLYLTPMFHIFNVKAKQNLLKRIKEMEQV
jgi:predicted metal-dependent HD superfamily phosphohydrolase